jgi:hypothetical protein
MDRAVQSKLISDASDESPRLTGGANGKKGCNAKFTGGTEDCEKY